MKKIFYFLAIFFLTFSCSQKPKLSQEDFFNFFLLNERANRVTLEGRAMKGRVKDALVRVVPLNSNGKCEANHPQVLGMSLTDEKGNYSIKYNRFGSPVCVFVLPNLEKNSVMYDEFSRQDISWTGNSFLVSVMNEPSVSKRERKGLSLTPFTRFGRALRNSKT